MNSRDGFTDEVFMATNGFCRTDPAPKQKHDWLNNRLKPWMEEQPANYWRENPLEYQRLMFLQIGIEQEYKQLLINP